jgi:hypothetical protein
VSARPFLRRPSVIAQSVEPLHASRVARALSSTPTHGSHVSVRVSLHGNVSGKAFYRDRSDPSPDRVSPGVSFAACRVSGEAALRQPAVPPTVQWRLLVRVIGRRVRPPGYVPSLHVQIRPPGSKEIYLLVRLRAPFRLLLLLA